MKVIFKVFFQIYLLFIVSWYMPLGFSLVESSYTIGVDFFYLYLLIQSFFLKRYQLILLGSLLGFLMDLDLDSNYLGFNTLFTPIFCYFVALIKMNASNWTQHFQLIYMLTVLFFSFLNKYLYFKYSLAFFDLLCIFINSVIVVVIFIFLNKYFYNKKLFE
ncbi:MAG: hypothetical protein CMG00_04625 [Candidatus Marinimicrobia bacterium]|nr:hypothetical protein [Candidatus Neomarinimicrobiota bacterium]